MRQDWQLASVMAAAAANVASHVISAFGGKPRMFEPADFDPFARPERQKKSSIVPLNKESLMALKSLAARK